MACHRIYNEYKTLIIIKFDNRPTGILIMAKVTVVGNGKGGVGKSLIACNMAVVLSLAKDKGPIRVLLIDGDVQASATMFTDMRAETVGPDVGYDCVSIRGAAIRNQMRSLAEKYDHVIVDCGGRDNPSLRAAVTVADRLVIPVPPRSVDEWALAGMVELVQEARAVINPNLKSHVVINMADPQGVDNEAVKAAIETDYLTPPEDLDDPDAWIDPGVEIVSPVIVKRKPFADAFGAGLSIAEHRPADRKAIDELLQVMAVVYTQDTRGKADGHSIESENSPQNNTGRRPGSAAVHRRSA